MCNPKSVTDSCLRKIGIFLVTIAAISMLLGVVCLVVCVSPVKYSAGPLWTGAFVIVTGTCAYRSGLAGSEHTKRCWLIAFLTLDIIAIFLTFGGWCLAIAATADDSATYYYYDDYPISISLNSIHLVIGLIEWSTIFIFSIVACCATCCNPKSNQRQTVVYQAAAGQQAVILQPGQQLVPAPQGHGMMIIQTAQPQFTYQDGGQQPFTQPIQLAPPYTESIQTPPYTQPPYHYNEQPPSYDSIQPKE